MAYPCASKVRMTTPAMMPRLSNNTVASVRTRPFVERRSHVGQVRRLIRCKAVSKPEADDRFKATARRPKLPREVLERIVLQQKLDNENTEEVWQKSQTKRVQAEAYVKKAVRACTTAETRSRQIASRKRQLQTKLDHLSSMSDVDQLQATLEGTEESLQRNLASARIYQNKYYQSTEEKAHAAHLKTLALAEKANAEKQAQELELKREQELQAYCGTINTRTVQRQFMFELIAKALWFLSTTASRQNRSQENQSSKLKPSDEKTKQQPRFL